MNGSIMALLVAPAFQEPIGVWFASVWGTNLWNKSVLKGGSPCREVLGSRPELALTGYSSTLGSRLGRRQWSSDNKMKGTFWRHLSLRKWWPWMVTESEWGLSRCDVRLVSKHCGDSRGGEQCDRPFFPMRNSSFKKASSSSKRCYQKPPT